jgi:hypothetical protein
VINLLSEGLNAVFSTKRFTFRQFCMTARAPSPVAYATRFAQVSEKLPHDHGAQRLAPFLLRS